MKWLFLFIALLFLPTASHANTFNAESFTLDNGLQVVIIPNNRAPVVTHMVWYKVGAADEPPTKSGMAHYFEHLMFKGTETLAPGEFSKRVKDLGGNDNAFTSQDYTAYFQSVPKAHLEDMMRMEAGRMRAMHVSEDDIRAERDVILEERSQRTVNNPDAQLIEHIPTCYCNDKIKTIR